MGAAGWQAPYWKRGLVPPGLDTASQQKRHPPITLSLSITKINAGGSS